MGRRWGLLVGVLGAAWLLGSGQDGRQPAESAAQRCFCQVRPCAACGPGRAGRRGPFRVCTRPEGAPEQPLPGGRGPVSQRRRDLGAPPGSPAQAGGVGARCRLVPGSSVHFSGSLLPGEGVHSVHAHSVFVIFAEPGFL